MLSVKNVFTEKYFYSQLALQTLLKHNFVSF